MTKKGLNSLGWKWKSHLSMEGLHCSVYAAEYKGLRIDLCIRVPMRDGCQCGRAMRHYLFNGKTYKSDSKLTEAVNRYMAVRQVK